MKQKDIALIIVVVFVSAVLSLFISSKIFGKESHDQQAEVVQAISSEFAPPDERFFNKDSIDATQTINIETNTNTAPFSGSGQ